MKKVIIPILILSSFILGGCLKKGEDGKISLGGSSKGDPFKGSIGAAAKLGVPYKCKMKVDGETESIGYIKGKNYRGKTQDGRTGDIVELLMKDNCTWIWSEEKTEAGVKMCYEGEMAEMMWNEEAGKEMMDDFNDMAPEGYEAPDFELDCNPTIIPPGTFNLPSGREFTDMTQLMNNMFGDGEGADNFGAEQFQNMETNVDMEKLMEQYKQ